jgi:hypothetical protein
MPSRDWYANLLMIHLQRADNQKLGDLPTNRFDRRICQLHEHFKFLVLAVSNQVFGADFTSLMLPIDDESLVLQPSPSLEASIVSFEMAKTPKKVLFQRTPYSIESQMSVNEEINLNKSPRWMSFKPLIKTKDPLRVSQLPAANDLRWTEGVIWKGVYLRLLLRVEGLSLLNQMNLLKEAIYPKLAANHYEIEDASFICYEIAMMQLTDLGSFFLFATPMVNSESISFREDLQVSTNPISKLFSDLGIKVSLQSRTVPLEKGTKTEKMAKLHLIHLIKKEQFAFQLTGLQRECGSRHLDMTILDQKSLFDYLSRAFPRIESAILKQQISFSILKCFKSHSIESNFP